MAPVLRSPQLGKKNCLLHSYAIKRLRLIRSCYAGGSQKQRQVLSTHFGQCTPTRRRFPISLRDACAPRPKPSGTPTAAWLSLGSTMRSAGPAGAHYVRLSRLFVGAGLGAPQAWQNDESPPQMLPVSVTAYATSSREYPAAAAVHGYSPTCG
jgi:hypothetical protein